jgi:hypothetical protein
MNAPPRVARWRVTGSLSVLAVVASIALAACGSTVVAKDTRATAGSGLCASSQSVQRLMVERINQLPQNHEHFTFPARIAVNDSAQAQAVAKAVCALPSMPHGTFACPADLGLRYRLLFTVDGKTLPAVTADAGGCRTVEGLGRVLWTARTPGFWNTLATAMNIPASNSTFSGMTP